MEIRLGGSKARSKNRFKVVFDITYEPGELIAISYENGIEQSRYCLYTEAQMTLILPEQDQNRPDELAYVWIQALGENK